MSTRVQPRRAAALALMVAGLSSGCARCAPSSSAGPVTSARATWVATITAHDRSVGELDEVGRRVLAALARHDASTAVGSIASEHGVRVVLEAPTGIDAQAFAASLSGVAGGPVRLERYETPPATRHFLVADLDRGVMEAQVLTVDDVAAAVASATPRPTTVGALGALSVANGADGPLTLFRAAQVRDETRTFRAWTTVLRVRAADFESVQRTLRRITLALRGLDPTLAVRILPRDRTVTEARIDDARARQRGIDPVQAARSARRLLAWHRVLDGVIPIVLRAQPRDGSELQALGVDGPDGLGVALSDLGELVETSISSPLVRDAAGRAVGVVLVAGGDDTVASLERDLQLDRGATVEVLARRVVSPTEQALFTLGMSTEAAEDLAETPAGPTVPAAEVVPLAP